MDKKAARRGLREKYRDSLKESGYSMEAHIEDLDIERLRWKGTSSSKFLIRLAHYYHLLPLVLKRIFKAEILEKGRYYEYWWMQFHTKSEFEALLGLLAGGLQ